MQDAPIETALKCFITVARYHGVDLSADRLKHDYALKSGDEVDKLLPIIARKSGFRAKAMRLSWKSLDSLGEAFPAIARLSNGNSVILLGVQDDTVGVVDPLADRPGIIRLKQAAFCKQWRGDILLLRR